MPLFSFSRTLSVTCEFCTCGKVAIPLAKSKRGDQCGIRRPELLACLAVVKASMITVCLSDNSSILNLARGREAPRLHAPHGAAQRPRRDHSGAEAGADVRRWIG